MCTAPCGSRSPPEASGWSPRLARTVADLKPVYLICGDDDAKIDAWRARVRARAETEQGRGGLEHFDGKADGAEAVATALSAMTFATGTRYLLAEPVEGWKADDLEAIVPSLAAMPPETVLVLIARGAAPAKLAKAVEKVGEVREYGAPKAWELPKWIMASAHEQGLALDVETAKLLVHLVGPRQQRLQREIEKIRLGLHPAGHATAADVEELAAGETAAQVYDLADAIVAADLRVALELAEELRAADERPGKLTYGLMGRLREVHRVAALLDAGYPEAKLAGAMKKPPWLVKRIVAQAKKADRETLERAIEALADFEVSSRGGGDRHLDEDTAFTLTLARAATR